MFFNRDHFAKLNLEPKQKDDVAKVATETVKESAVILYGSIHNGRPVDFTSFKKPQDTHVCFGVFITEMGALPPHEEYGSYE